MIFFILLPWAAQILDKTIHVDHIFSREDNLTRTNTHLLPIRIRFYSPSEGISYAYDTLARNRVLSWFGPGKICSRAVPRVRVSFLEQREGNLSCEWTLRRARRGDGGGANRAAQSRRLRVLDLERFLALLARRAGVSGLECLGRGK